MTTPLSLYGTYTVNTPSRQPNDIAFIESTQYSFGDFVLDTQLFQLRRGSDVIPLEPKVFDVLRYLVEHHDRVATKRELLDALWPNEVVTEAVLPTNINALRRALGQKRGDKQPIETIHGRGYRFAMPVTRSIPPRGSDPDGRFLVENLPSLAPISVSEADPFFGRSALLSKLKRCLVRALGDQSQICVLSGEAGIGKTRTAQWIAELARAHGADVWVGSCHEGEGAPAFWPWAQVMRSAYYAEGGPALRAWLGPAAADVVPWVPDLAESVDAQTPVSAPSLEHASFRALDAVARLLGQAARVRPRVVLLEDMHRADEASWQLLRLLAPTLERCAVLILVTLRSRDDLTVAAPVQRNVDALSRLPSCSRFYMRGLELTETREMIRHLLGTEVSDDLCQALSEKTGGNPLFLRELCEWLLARGRIDAEALSEAPGVAPPEVVRHVLDRRVARLGAVAQRVLETASVIGPMWDVSSVEALTGRTREEVLAAIDLALEQRIVVPVSSRVDAYRFAHDLLRDTLYSGLSLSLRKRLHLHTARVLQERLAWLGADAVREIAQHYYQALPEGDPREAIQWLRRAAEVSEATQAFEDAARYYRSALDATRLLPIADPALGQDLMLARARAQECAKKARIAG
jgi:predicted ATPase/DNA-binding winged helix-turn-helix (wHTH) protein